MALLGAAFQACPEALAVVEGGIIVYANRPYARLFGYSESAELVGKPLAEMVPDKHACTVRGESAACGYTRCRFKGRRRDGSRTDIESSCSPLHCSGRALLVISSRDVSNPERRRVVRESEQRFRAIFEASAIGIGHCTLDGKIVETNRALERMLGYSRQELRGVPFQAVTHPADREEEEAVYQEIAAGVRDHYELEKRYVRKDGNCAWGRVNVSLVRGPGGEPQFAILMVEDINERKRAEQQLQQAQKMEAIGQLVGGVAHDFNNLLTAIMLYSDLLIAGLKNNLGLRRHGEEIRLASERGAALIQQLLAFARHQPALEPRVLSLNVVLMSMRNLLARLIGEDVELITTCAEGLGNVKADLGQMQQVILNLALNARDAMAEGGKLTLESSNFELDAGHAGDYAPLAPGAYVRLTVTDTGSGMDADTLSHLFELFFTTKKQGKGYGLGLVTVQRIVSEGGGLIRVDSELGKGTRVTALLPRVSGQAEPLPPDSHTEPALEGSETVLLLEDDTAVRSSVRRVLAQCGYRVLEARNGTEALEIARQHPAPIHLLLSDLVMPGLSGREAARQIRLLRPGLRVLYISAYSEVASTAEAAGPEVLLFRKPFSGSALARKVRQALQTESEAENRLHRTTEGKDNDRSRS